jgi:hypothetical protein
MEKIREMTQAKLNLQKRWETRNVRKKKSRYFINLLKEIIRNTDFMPQVQAN